MKSCPDCAEHVQPAARKCRFCGYRFDDVTDGSGDGDDELAASDDGAEGDASDDLVAAEAAPPSPGFLLTALGGLALLAAATAGVVAVIEGAENVGPAVKLTNLAGYISAGVLLAIGWGFACARDQAGWGGVLGAVALIAGQLVALDLTGPLARDLTTTVAMSVFLFLQLGTLEKAGFDGTRAAALTSLVGFGGLLLGFFNQWELPAWLATSLGWCGLGGLALFGLTLSIASFQRLGKDGPR